MQRPVSLLDDKSGSLTLTREWEPAYCQSRQGRVDELVTAKKKKTSLVIPVYKKNHLTTVYAGERYDSNLKFLTDRKIQDTRLYFNGRGSANVIAQRIGKLRLGYFLNQSRESGRGTSMEINSRIQNLDADSTTLIEGKSDREGVQVSYDINRRLTASILKTDDHIWGDMRVFDAGDLYVVPVHLNGGRWGGDLKYEIGLAYKITAAVNFGKMDNLDSIKYNNSIEMGRWLSRDKYRLLSLYLEKKKSAHHTTLFGYELYDGSYYAAGTVDFLGSSSSFLGGFYLFHTYGHIGRSTLVYAVSKKKGRNAFMSRFAVSDGGAALHSDSLNSRLFSTTYSMPVNKAYDYKQFEMGLGIERKAGKKISIQYSFLQTVPLLKEKEGLVPPPSTSLPISPKVSKNTRGGGMHLLAFRYCF